MKIIEILESRNTPFSFEFFPPKTAKGWDNLFLTIAELNPLKPAYVSVTYGAGGATRDRTHQLLQRILSETDLEVVAHLTCIGSDKRQIETVLRKYADMGVANILALGGDPPQGQPDMARGDFPHAADLVAFIKRIVPQMGVGAACFPEGHPATPNRLREIEYLKQKVDAGVDYLVTQLFFDNRDYFDFKARAALAGIKIPIIAGIMPITSFDGMTRMADLAAGARFPAPLLKAVNRALQADMVKEVGIQWASEQIRELIDAECPGIHLYTLNNSDASIRICRSLGLRNYAL